MEKEEIKKAFLEMKTREDVSCILGINDRSLRYFLYKRRPENLYKTFEITKHNGSKRKISAPHKEWKTIQRKLADVLSCVYTPKVCAYGFVPGKGIVGNANQHTKRSLVLNIDLKDFFSQIHFGRVRGMLMKAPYSLGAEAATTIAQIVCVNRVLPQGSPCSPILTNMICVPLDNSMMTLARSMGCVYTRYADDITFSTFKKEFDPEIVYYDGDRLCVGSKLQHILDKHSFTVNPEKMKLQRHSAHQEVTGLTVNVFPNLRRNYIKNLRAMLHHCEKDGMYNTAKQYISKGFCSNTAIIEMCSDPDKQVTVEGWFSAVLKGKIEYIRQVKGEKSLTYLSFAQKLNQVSGQNIFDISALNQLEAIAEKNTFILEYSDDDNWNQGSGFYIPGVGLITSYHVVENGNFFKVYNFREYASKHSAVVGISLNVIAYDETIDYAVFNVSLPNEDEYTLKIGDSTKLKTGDPVTIIGYPNHNKGNTPYIQNCAITSQKLFLQAPFITVSGRIVHGASGGLVLNSNHDVVGIIKGGISTLSEEDNENQGFIPIHLALNHMKSSNNNNSD